MFKKPWTNTGNIRYFEVIKIAVFTTVVMMTLAMSLQATPTLHESALFPTILFMLLIILHALSLNYELYQIISLILSYTAMTLIHCKKRTLPVIFEYIYNALFLPFILIEKRYRSLCVIRC